MKKLLIPASISITALLSACNFDVSTPEGNVTVDVSDSTPPTLTITSPSSESTSVPAGEDLVLSGTASDNVALAEVTWTLDTGESGTADGKGSWVISGLPLDPGNHTITVAARDTSDNTTERTVEVIVEDGNSGTPDPNDTTPPEVVATSPADGAGSAAPDVSITATFSEDIDSGSLSGAVSLTGPGGAVGFSTGVQGTSLVITPEGTLQDGTAYTVNLGTGITDLAGNALAQDYTWSFSVVQTACTGEYDAGFALVEGKDTTAPGTMNRPAKGVPYSDPAYGTCVVRVTDHETEAPSGFARNDYSRRQAFNADGSMLLVYAYNGYWHVYDANDLSYIRQLSMGGSEVEPQWHPTNPELLYIFPHNGGMTISEYNVLTDTRRVVADFRNVESIAGHPGATSIQEIWPSAGRAWTKSEGSPSADARYWGLMVETDGFGGLGLMTYDMQTNTITGVYDYETDGGGINRPDHVSMSPTGEHIVASWYSPSCPSSSDLGTLNNPCGLMSYSRDFSSATGLAKLGEHSDIALDAAGNDVIVMSNYVSGYVEMYDLATGATTQLWNMYIDGAATALHVSGKNYNKPGWVLISTYATNNPRGADLWYEKKIMAVELTDNPRIYNIAHTYNETDQYFSEPHAVVNRDFTRILFNSNWNTANFQDIDAYMITLPASAIPTK